MKPLVAVFLEAQTGNATITYSVVPEPSSLAILGLSAVACSAVSHRRVGGPERI